MHGSAHLQQNPSSPWYHQLQVDENNKPAVDLNDLLKNTSEMKNHTHSYCKYAI